MGSQSNKGQLIHQQHDAFGVLQVVENNTARSLYFGNSVEQGRLNLDSPMRLPLEYQQVIEAHILTHHQTHPVQRILMLGMGGGSLASHLHLLHPDSTIHIVELRQAVIDIAYDYFQLPEVPEIEAIQEDAFIFIKEALSQYDVIIVDVFDESGVPEPFTTSSFQQDLVNNLTPSGLILFNLWANQSENQQKHTQQVIDYWQAQSCTTASTRNIRLNAYPISSTENIILSIQIQMF